MKSFATITGDDSTGWRKMPGDQTVEINGRKYLRTDCMKAESDNLGSLAEF